MKKLLLISGKAEHGKTTAANIIKDTLEQQGYKVVITRYAEYLKTLAKNYLKWDGVKDEHGRHILQYLGTDIIRKKMKMPNFHVNRVCEDIQICEDFVDYVIIDDVRFKNEIYIPKAIFDDKVFTIRISRINPFTKTPYESSLTAEQKAHSSETDLDNFCFNAVIIAEDTDQLKYYLEEMLNEQIISDDIEIL